MNKFQVHIEPPSEGWLRIRIAGPNGETRLCASYTPRDTFSELVHAMGTLYRSTPIETDYLTRTRTGTAGTARQLC
jgi:hypothetical protein